MRCSRPPSSPDLTPPVQAAYDQVAREEFTVLCLGIYVDKTEAGKCSVQPVNLIALGMPRDKVFTRAATYRVADIPVISVEGPGLSKEWKALLQHWVTQKTLELALARLKRLSFT